MACFTNRTLVLDFSAIKSMDCLLKTSVSSAGNPAVSQSIPKLEGSGGNVLNSCIFLYPLGKVIPTSFEIQDFVDVPFLRQFSFHYFIVRIFHHKSPGNALMVGRQLDRCHGLQDPKFLAVSGPPSISIVFFHNGLKKPWVFPSWSIHLKSFWGTMGYPKMESPRPRFWPAAFSKCATLGSSGAKRRRHEKAPRRSINCRPMTAVKFVGIFWHRKFTLWWTNIASENGHLCHL